MINNVDFSSTFPPITASFLYDPSKPTLQTEKLSYGLLKMLGELGSNGANILVDTSTIEEKRTLLATYKSDLATWATDAFSRLAVWLTEDEGTRSPLVIPAATSLAVSTASLVLLPPALLLNTVVDTIADLSQTYMQSQAIARQKNAERILTKALFDDSFWLGTSTSKIDRLIDVLKTALGGTDEVSVKQTLFDMKFDNRSEGISLDEIKTAINHLVYGLMGEKEYPLEERSLHSVLVSIASNPGLIKLLSRIVISSGGDINEEEFTLAGSVEPV